MKQTRSCRSGAGASCDIEQSLDLFIYRPMSDSTPSANRRARGIYGLLPRMALLTALALLVFATVATAADRPAYKLGTGDKLRVTVYNEKNLSGDYEVSDRGSIAMPLIGQVDVAGLTVSDAEMLITSKYGEKYLVNPRIGIEVLNYRPFFILGEVKNPGGYPYVSGMSVLNAVSLAGGFTPRADERDIVVKHAADSTGREQQVTEDTPVLPGDILRVNKRMF
jgi:protein involved in polysaccharide export with SLBB domain